MTPPPIVLVFLKAPVPGRVKTRLASEVGDEVAASVYRQLVENQLRHIPPHWRTRIVYDPPEALDRFHAWLGRHHDYQPQASGDLGDRLKAACRQAFAEGHPHVICIGGDCPTLCPDTFAEALTPLTRGADVVVAPAEDGGYVLLATRAYFPTLFDNIPWSSEHALSTTLSRAHAANLHVTQLDTRFDVDTLSDLKRAVQSGCFRTQEFLHEIT